MHELSSLQCGRDLQLVSFGHWLESLQLYHGGEWFRETPQGFHTDGELGWAKGWSAWPSESQKTLPASYSGTHGFRVCIRDASSFCRAWCCPWLHLDFFWCAMVHPYTSALSSRHQAAVHRCHNQPWPWPRTFVSSLGEGTALVSTWLSARSRCRWWDPQLDTQTPKCSGVAVVIAVYVAPSGKEQWSESRRVTPLSWPNGRTVGRYLLALLCFQQEH